MANLIFWSDLHLEFAPFDLPDISDFAAKPDALLLAGDTATRMKHLAFALLAHDAYKCPVILIDGNHEFYNGNIEMIETEEDIRTQQFRKAGVPIHVLRGGSVEVAGTRIAGATLWTDFNIWPELTLAARSTAVGTMNDFLYIRTGPDNGLFTVPKSIVKHEAEKKKLFDTLAEPFDGPTVVMTHHIPVSEAVHPKYWRDPLTAAFANDLIEEIEALPFDYWIYGHSHENLEFSIETSSRARHFVSNPRGYPSEKTRFDPLRMITT